MDQKGSKWETDELTRTYLEGVRSAIPAAGLQLEVIDKIVNMWRPQPSRILDLGCGDGVLGRMLLDAHPAARVIFADISDPMLEAAKKRIGDNPQATVVKADFATPDWIKQAGGEAPFDVIVSGFAIHHQPDVRKQALYAEIYGLLGEGGMFLNLDHVSSAAPSGGALFDDFFIDHIRRFASSADEGHRLQEIEDAYYRDKKDNLLAAVETQCRWLRDIGFQDVDCFLKVFEMALFGGRKASGR